MKTIWASFPAISLDWIDERLDCLVFLHCSWLTLLALLDKSFLRKWYQICLGEDLLQGSLEIRCLWVENVASQIKWLSCMFTSIFGDISMTTQAETLLKGEGWRCPFTQERGGVIHQRGCCPFSTARPQLPAANHPSTSSSDSPPTTTPLSTSLFLSLSVSPDLLWSNTNNFPGFPN